MTKTITQLQPLIYATLLTDKRPIGLREKLLRILRGIAFCIYVAAGLRISADTGLAPWDWEYWLMLFPLFALGEWSLRELSRWIPADEERHRAPLRG
jgi:hypothetical protein